MSKADVCESLRTYANQIQNLPRNHAVLEVEFPQVLNLMQKANALIAMQAKALAIAIEKGTSCPHCAGNGVDCTYCGCTGILPELVEALGELGVAGLRGEL
jgi:hypothetical protein